MRPKLLLVALCLAVLAAPAPAQSPKRFPDARRDRRGRGPRLWGLRFRGHRASDAGPRRACQGDALHGAALRRDVQMRRNALLRWHRADRSRDRAADLLRSAVGGATERRPAMKFWKALAGRCVSTLRSATMPPLRLCSRIYRGSSDARRSVERIKGRSRDVSALSFRRLPRSLPRRRPWRECAQWSCRSSRR